MSRQIFAIADLHLSGAHAKPMDVFGPHWADHDRAIQRNWRATVGKNDIVLIAGDISWALKLEDAVVDLEWLADLPGTKVLLRGNHDYWWSGIKKIRRMMIPGLHFIQNDVVEIDGVAVGGTRLWEYPTIKWIVPRMEAPVEVQERQMAGHGHKQTDDEKMRRRELERLKLSLAQRPPDADVFITMTHYPPIGSDATPTQVSAIVSEYDVDYCVFGHIHGLPREPEPPGSDMVLDGTRYILTSSDWLDFSPKLLAEVD